MSTVMWFRRDLRLGDNPALCSAVAGAADTAGVVPLFVADPSLLGPAGPVRRRYLAASLTDLASRIGGLQLRYGDPVREVVAVARAASATSVHIAAEFGHFGHRRDLEVEAALARYGIQLVASGSAYAVPPGQVRTKSGGPYKVFTPYSRSWREMGWEPPWTQPTAVHWIRPLPSRRLDQEPVADNLGLPAAGELAALRRWNDFLHNGLDDYAANRDRADLEGTSRMSVHLKWGEIHPRTMLADLGRHPGPSATRYATELAWREFFADLLWANPNSAREYLHGEFADMDYDQPGVALVAWCEGRTGYPIIDAGMRQLRAEGWMHNRVRMLVASFLVKDLHIQWRHGARHFMRWLVDADLASNQHGWQWCAGCGADAAPYYRIFNPTRSGKRVDPRGDYVRKYVPELAAVSEKWIHEPWTMPGGAPNGYPARIVAHDVERREALRRLAALRK